MEIVVTFFTEVAGKVLARVERSCSHEPSSAEAVFGVSVIDEAHGAAGIQRQFA